MRLKWRGGRAERRSWRSYPDAPGLGAPAVGLHHGIFSGILSATNTTASEWPRAWIADILETHQPGQSDVRGYLRGLIMPPHC